MNLTKFGYKKNKTDENVAPEFMKRGILNTYIDNDLTSIFYILQ